MCVWDREAIVQSKLLSDQGAKTWVLIFESGDELISILTAFAKAQGLDSSHFTAIGAFERATLGYFDRRKRDYLKIPVDEQVEVLSLIGDIALDKGEPKIHAHVVVGRSDGSTRGGHILDARVWPTLEVVLTETPKELRRRHDPESGLALIRV
jgi:predicted DNA-binding protein with PD1-like motif